MSDAGAPGSTVVLSAGVLRRLALIRHLHSLGVQQTSLPELQRAVALLAFHDCIDWFLQLACEVHKVPVRDRAYLRDYLRALQDAGQDVKMAKEVEALNTARNDLKHNAKFPASLNMESYALHATSFFHLNTPLLFGIQFGDISLLQLIHNPAVLSALEESEELMRAEKPVEALKKVAAAFVALVNEVSERMPTLFRNRTFRQDISLTKEALLGVSEEQSGNNPELAALLDKLVNSLWDMRGAVDALALGLDFKRYPRFQHLTRHLIQGSSWSRLEVWEGPWPSGGNPLASTTLEDCCFCFDFVVDSALHLQAVSPQRG